MTFFILLEMSPPAGVTMRSQSALRSGWRPPDGRSLSDVIAVYQRDVYPT